ncbi:MAG: dienelactone hydrolase family protein [Proteobacteria bacterium]|jgi:phospholipase/carboxylesterase|nr:dienelactone hydrolase family protein [Pseudomonadota bacterium]MDA1300164.1 dienelactone hydrolase family protein [Pseudomonadota bacterium]
MTDDNDALVDGITTLMPRLLTTLTAFEQIQRNMHPERVPQLADFIAPYEDELRDTFAPFRSLQVPAHLEAFFARLSRSTEYCLRACNGFTGPGDDRWATMKAMRAHCRAQEFLFPIASIMTPVNQYFIEDPVRDREAFLSRFDEDTSDRDPAVGLMHFQNDRDVRGGFSLYVPEFLTPAAHPSLVVALHGGTGHGADFIWSWVREARTRGFILLAPTSQQDTWSLMGEEHDLVPLTALVRDLMATWQVDAEHVLLTGMSDGGTYALMAGLQDNSPFTHLAPFSGVLHPEIMMTGRLHHAHGRPIYLVHGTQDWMFPIESAYMAKAELEAAGAELTFHAIEGLSHNYARFQNPQLLDWFNPALSY